MTKSGHAQDEAMDAILASIRSMMSDADEDQPGIASSPEPEPPPDNVRPIFSPPASVVAAMPSVSSREEPRQELPSIDDIGPEFRPNSAVDRAMTRAMEEAQAEVRRDEVVIGDGPSPERHEEPHRPRSVATVEELGQDRERRPVERVAAERPMASLPPKVASQESASQPLLSREADAAVSGAFQELATSVLSGGGRTIDDLVEDLLRPMLRDWLDNNLPSMVERLVREEIERVARGRR